MIRCHHAGLVLLLLLVSVAVAVADPALRPLRLHPDLPRTIEGEWLQRLGLFEDVTGLQRVTFERAVWGGVLARLEAPPRTLERHLPIHRWQALQERVSLVLAGRDVPPEPAPTPPDSLSGTRAWPVGPPPPTAPSRRPRPSSITPVDGRWLAIVEVGVRADVTGFNQFFGPMGQVGIAFGRAVTGHVVPQLGFYAGFGDMRGDFEHEFGDGRANGFGFTSNVLLRAGLGDRQSLYVEGGVGYHIRSLYWGNAFEDRTTGRVYQGRVDEQRHFGWNARVGWWLARAAGSNRPRLLDVGVGVHSMPADPWRYVGDEATFAASARDTWLMLTVRIWDGL